MTETTTPSRSAAPGLAAPGLADKYRELHELLDQIAELESTACTDRDIVAIAESHERAARRMSSIGHRRLLDVSDRGIHTQLGYRGLADFLAERLRITDVRRRQRHAVMLGRLHSIHGELLAPRCPATAAALAEGAIGADHVQAVLDTLHKIPDAVGAETRSAAEATMAEFARDHAPKQLIRLGQRLIGHLDPDGTLTDDRDRARRRRLTVGDQDGQLMSRLTGDLDPATRAMLDVVLAAWAAPGMNNPDDETSPTGVIGDVDPDDVKAAAARDTRSEGQRQHDAFKALLAASLSAGVLGRTHRGLPAHVVVKINESRLREMAGIGCTATGCDIPIGDAIELAARTQWHLAVFADHTAQPLYFGRARRLASQAQRLMLFAGSGGCSAPGCTMPASHVEVHHAAADFADGGTTDIDTMGPACPIHNRRVGGGVGQFTTSMVRDGPDAGRVAWRRNSSPNSPPSAPRVNHIQLVDEIVERHLADGNSPPRRIEPST